MPTVRAKVAHAVTMTDIDVPALSQRVVSKQPRYAWKYYGQLTTKRCAAKCSGSFFVQER
ncbi:hypothetical protein [Bradyrhizobium sp. HKCCYLS20291]|uniref:hypothetical protein n=1 Tax=Bradyrhizobium sp. HKCCYLS20291 TaxID=3420766 RepID=UPI003EB8CC63